MIFMDSPQCRLLCREECFCGLPAQIDYDDYRPVDGIQTPFEVRVTDWESVSAEKLAEVTFNQAIDPARFAKPVARPASASGSPALRPRIGPRPSAR